MYQTSSKKRILARETGRRALARDSPQRRQSNRRPVVRTAYGILAWLVFVPALFAITQSEADAEPNWVCPSTAYEWAGSNTGCLDRSTGLPVAAVRSSMPSTTPTVSRVDYVCPPGSFESSWSNTGCENSLGQRVFAVVSTQYATPQGTMVGGNSAGPVNQPVTVSSTTQGNYIPLPTSRSMSRCISTIATLGLAAGVNYGAQEVVWRHVGYYLGARLNVGLLSVTAMWKIFNACDIPVERMTANTNVHQYCPKHVRKGFQDGYRDSTVHYSLPLTRSWWQSGKLTCHYDDYVWVHNARAWRIRSWQNSGTKVTTYSCNSGWYGTGRYCYSSNAAWRAKLGLW